MSKDIVMKTTTEGSRFILAEMELGRVAIIILKCEKSEWVASQSWYLTTEGAETLWAALDDWMRDK